MMDFLASPWGLTLAGVLLVAAALVGLFLVFTPSRRVSIERRRPADSVQPSVLTRTAQATTAGAGRLLGGREAQLQGALELSGLRTAPRDFVVLVTSGTLALFAVGLLLWGPWGGLLLAATGPLIAWVVVRVATSRRRKAFGNQLDETLQILAGSLRAGYSLPQAAATVASEAEAPTSEEFARVINETRVGRPMVEALEDAAGRVRSDDFFWVTQAIAINREVGGNLADVLEGVSQTIRERTQLHRQVEALSAEGRLSAIILGALPFVVLVVLSMLNPGYVGAFGESPLGILMAVGAGILLLIGLLWLRVTVRIKY